MSLAAMTAARKPESLSTHSAECPASPFDVLKGDLARLAILVDRLDDAQYQSCGVGAFEGSIGAHIRHCLDHVEAFLAGLESGRINYDDRQRGTPSESSRRAAADRIALLQNRTREHEMAALERPILLSAMLTPHAPRVEVCTSVGRELVFTLSHTTHHNAIIAAMSRTLGIAIPADFGVAASTLAYRKDLRCAR